jgi:hypothetical protein
LKTGDKIAFFLLAILILLAVVIRFSTQKINSKAVEIRVDGKIYKDTALIGQSLELPVKSTEGKLTVQINNNKVRVIDSTCKDHLCVKQGWISRVGETIICLPNRISLTIIGGGSGIDSTTY